jgi:hypothetical protein
MRYRTAAILSAVFVLVIIGMFSLPAAVEPVFLPYMERGVDPPTYVKILYVADELCSTWKWIFALLVPPTVVMLFIIAAFTGRVRQHKLTKTAS